MKNFTGYLWTEFFVDYILGLKIFLSAFSSALLKSIITSSRVLIDNFFCSILVYKSDASLLNIR